MYKFLKDIWFFFFLFRMDMIIIRYTSPRLCIACPAGRFTEFIDDIERPLIRSERLRRLRPKRERNEMREGPWISKGPANFIRRIQSDAHM
jgi:hypothetical protein